MDGHSHVSYAKQSKDQERDARINDLGITVLRFENKIVFEQPEEIINQIRNHTKG
jgi:very-short-patch-repair endonuclease